MSLLNIAKRISNDVISVDDAILAISIMDMQGNILASQFKPAFKDKFEFYHFEEKSSSSEYD